MSHWSFHPLTTTYLFTYSFSCVCTLPSTCGHSLFSDGLHQHAGRHYVSMVTNICQWYGVTLFAKWRWEWEIKVKISRQNLFLIWKCIHSELSALALRLPPHPPRCYFPHSCEAKLKTHRHVCGDQYSDPAGEQVALLAVHRVTEASLNPPLWKEHSHLFHCCWWDDLHWHLPHILTVCIIDTTCHLPDYNNTVPKGAERNDSWHLKLLSEIKIFSQLPPWKKIHRIWHAPDYFCHFSWLFLMWRSISSEIYLRLPSDRMNTVHSRAHVDKGQEMLTPRPVGV